MVLQYIQSIQSDIRDSRFVEALAKAEELETELNRLEKLKVKDIAFILILSISIRVELERLAEINSINTSLHHAQLRYLESALSKAKLIAQQLLEGPSVGQMKY